MKFHLCEFELILSHGLTDSTGRHYTYFQIIFVISPPTEVATDMLQNTNIHLYELQCSTLCQNVFTAKAGMFMSYTPNKFNCE